MSTNVNLLFSRRDFILQNEQAILNKDSSKTVTQKNNFFNSVCLIHSSIALVLTTNNAEKYNSEASLNQHNKPHSSCDDALNIQDS